MTRGVGAPLAGANAVLCASLLAGGCLSGLAHAGVARPTDLRQALVGRAIPMFQAAARPPVAKSLVGRAIPQFQVKAWERMPPYSRFAMAGPIRTNMLQDTPSCALFATQSIGSFKLNLKECLTDTWKLQDCDTVLHVEYENISDQLEKAKDTVKTCKEEAYGVGCKEKWNSTCSQTIWKQVVRKSCRSFDARDQEYYPFGHPEIERASPASMINTSEIGPALIEAVTISALKCMTDAHKPKMYCNESYTGRNLGVSQESWFPDEHTLWPWKGFHEEPIGVMRMYMMWKSRATVYKVPESVGICASHEIGATCMPRWAGAQPSCNSSELDDIITCVRKLLKFGSVGGFCPNACGPQADFGRTKWKEMEETIATDINWALSDEYDGDKEFHCADLQEDQEKKLVCLHKWAAWRAAEFAVKNFAACNIRDKYDVDGKSFSPWGDGNECLTTDGQLKTEANFACRARLYDVVQRCQYRNILPGPLGAMLFEPVVMKETFFFSIWAAMTDCSANARGLQQMAGQSGANFPDAEMKEADPAVDACDPSGPQASLSQIRHLIRREVAHHVPNISARPA